ncbi:MAG: hypothetical protein SPF89_10595 [Sphaerochaetaceae bacterium]|nr:hypothetical protein [Spirochaetales bacterium]MDY5500542.1 hypothetical protein [Sphaerochaetaceae bacterium]
MSKFLGPIHYWLYGKIQLQDALVAEIADYASRRGWRYDPELVTSDLRPLESLIDTANIHGWLQGRIASSESRYAKLVSCLVEEDEGRLAELEQVAYSFGEHHKVQADANCNDAYHQFDEVLLNGMPCDRVNQVVEGDVDRFVWRQTQNLHGHFWVEAGGKGQWYDRLRMREMEGMLSGTSMQLTKEDDDVFVIEKKVA